MIDADRECGALAEPRARGASQLETQEMNRGGLLLVLALEVLVGDGVDALAAADLHPDAAFDTFQLREHPAPLVGVRVLDQHRRLPVAAVGHERVVGIELVADTLLLEDALDAQHLLHLVADRQLVLEEQRDVLAQGDAAVLLVLDDLRPEAGTLPGVGLEGQQGASFDHRSQSLSPSSAFWKRLAWLRSALASVSNQSAISVKPSVRACFAMPGYISVYSCVSPATAAFRFSRVRPIGRLVAGSPTVSRYSRWPCACPVSPSAVERKRAETSLWPSTSAFAAK